MNETTQIVDIIFLAIIAFFLVNRLLSVLGQRPEDDNQKDSSADHSNVIFLSDDDTQETSPLQADVLDMAMAAEAEMPFLKIKQKDPTFTTKEFLSGAKIAFDYIVTAFADKDREKLKPLLGEKVMASFDAAICDLEEKKLIRETDLIGFLDVTIEKTEVDNDIATIAVKFVTEQINFTRNEKGEVVEGNDNRIDTVTDIWTFQRDLTSSDPNWELAATRSV